MKQFKAILALVLVAALFCTLFAACAKTTETPAPSTNTNTNTPATPADNDTEEPAEGPDEEPAEPETYDPEDWVDIEMYYFDLRMVGNDYGEHIVNAINEYIGPKYGIQVNITYFVIGEWLTKVQLAISGGEQVDVLPLEAGNGVATMHTNNMILPIDEYMEEYAPETLELMGSYLDAYRYDGQLFGVPTYRGYCTNQYIIMRQDILDELGMTEKAKNMDSWATFEEIMAAVADKYTSETAMYALGVGTNKDTIPTYLWPSKKFSDVKQWDALGDTVGQVLTDTEGNISWVMEDPLQEAKYQMVAGWRANGWIYPDASLTETHGDELLKQGVQFASIQASEYGIEAVKSASIGYPLVCVQYAPGWVMTSTLTSWGIGVPVTAEEPEMGVRMINALYTDEYLMNLLTRGQEGVDYEVVDGEIVYPESGYYYEADFLIGNNTLLKPLKGQGADYFDQIKKINENAHVSEYLGFVFDNSELSLMIANLTAVYDQYRADLNTGNYTPELFNECKAKYEAAGIRDYIAEYQKQMDAWLGK